MSKKPLELSRITDMDLVIIEAIKEDWLRIRSESSNEEKETRAESLSGGMPKIQMTDELESNINHRGAMQLSIKKSMMLSKASEPEDIMRPGERTTSLYCRSSDYEKAELDDFELI